MDFFSPFVVSQILAGCAFVAGIISFQLRDRRAILLALMLTMILLATHFVVLGVFVGALLAAVSCVRFVVAAYTHARWVMYLFAILSICLGIVFYTHPYDLIAVVGVLLATVGSFQSDEKTLRICMLIASVFSFRTTHWLARQ